MEVYMFGSALNASRWWKTCPNLPDYIFFILLIPFWIYGYNRLTSKPGRVRSQTASAVELLLCWHANNRICICECQRCSFVLRNRCRQFSARVNCRMNQTESHTIFCKPLLVIHARIASSSDSKQLIETRFTWLLICCQWKCKSGWCNIYSTIRQWF